MKSLCKKPKCPHLASYGKEYCYHHTKELEKLKREYEKDNKKVG